MGALTPFLEAQGLASIRLAPFLRCRTRSFKGL
jgi:hypothetical protein